MHPCIEVVQMYDTEVDSANRTACVTGSLTQAPCLVRAGRPCIWHSCRACQKGTRHSDHYYWGCVSRVSICCEFGLIRFMDRAYRPNTWAQSFSKAATEVYGTNLHIYQVRLASVMDGVAFYVTRTPGLL